MSTLANNSSILFGKTAKIDRSVRLIKTGNGARKKHSFNMKIIELSFLTKNYKNKALIFLSLI